MSHSWESIRNQVRTCKSELTSIYPLQVLSTYKDFYIYNDTLYFLSNDRNNDELTPSRYLTMYKVDLTQLPTSVLKHTLAWSDYNVSTMSITDDMFLFTFNTSISIGQPNSLPRLIPNKLEQPRLDPTLGGIHNAYIAFIRDRDIWITDIQGHERQLTFSTDVRCGIAEYMMQEEFHRFTGYQWCPQQNKILYLETIENDVDMIYISKSDHPIRYPRAGKQNVKSCIKILEFNQQDIVCYGHDIKHQFPWMEYIVRFGWLPNGDSIWVQILSRDQKRTAVLKLYPSQWLKEQETEILWEETSTSWINVTDVYYFFHTEINHTKFIWSSEKVNGYRHLFLVEKYKHQPATITQLTHGNWCCIDKPIYVHGDIVYFSAKKETPLETHFYSLSLKDKQLTLLTKKGSSHHVTMNAPGYFIDCYSTLHDPQVILVHNLKKSSSALLFPIPILNYSINKQFIHTNGHLFNFTTSDGLLLYGCLYKPICYQPNKSYPTVLYIYGGPKTQLVMNEFKFPRLMRYLMSVYFGFAVVIIDSRGSSDRGLEFESYLQYHLGTVELRDQIQGLEFIHRTKLGGSEKSVIDLNRIAITGWSYGGYLSLMALAQYPHFFKMAIAGAPVTQWELYDAAYTERYMGLPKDNPKAYHQSNVTTYIDQFPDSDHRLLIAHGLMDENVHFKNTELLVAQLVKHNKPHYLQVYPSEKHGLRHASVNEHFETLMFYWLCNYL